MKNEKKKSQIIIKEQKGSNVSILLINFPAIMKILIG